MPEPLNESSGPSHSVRRAVTLPTKLNPQAQRGSVAPNLPDNVIFYHPSAKIVHFAPRALVPIPSSSAPSDFDYPVDTIETLPWRSATERTVATAPLRLERGLTVFLKCGNVVHAILKNSQCWCVDGVSKFVLRIRPLTYYRIELPYETAKDKELVEDLKAALSTVLRYEVTPCPFKRAFTVELPEEAIAPRRKKAWRPKERHSNQRAPPGSNQSHHLEIKTDWQDTASTGEDTDGAATDDSGLTSQRTNSTTSEPALTGDESPTSINGLDPSSILTKQKRYATEMPQSFTSLRAKFDSPPVLDEPPASQKPENDDKARPVDESDSVEDEPVFEEAVEPEEIDKFRHSAQAEEAFTLDAAPTEESPNSGVSLESPSRTRNGDSALVDTQTSPAHFIAGQDATLEEVFNATPPKRIADLAQASPIEETNGEPSRPSVLAQISLPLEEPSSEPGQDSCLSSSPESFHSVDLSPRKSYYLDATSVTNHDAASSPGTSVAGSVAEFSAKQASVAVSPANDSPPKTSALDAGSSPIESEHVLSEWELNIPKYIVREDRPSLSAPQGDLVADKVTDIMDIAGTSSVAPDYRHMSTEFRRRAQATRQRDVSPMPPSSTIYHPTSNDHASSLLSRALSLVLVPPIHLFVILLHVAARIVISPALATTGRDSSSGSKSSSKGPVTEDDFSFPLEREASSEYEDAQVTRKLDPWDLD